MASNQPPSSAMTLTIILIALTTTAWADTGAQPEGRRLPRHAATDNSIERGSQGYMLYLGAWSGCKHNTPTTDTQQPLPSGGLTFEPQVGMQTRDVKCQDAYETVVEMSRCLPKGSRIPSTHRSCLLPEDCVMSEWTSWTNEENGGAEPTMVRSRSIISLPQGTGKLCGDTQERKSSGEGAPATPSELFRWAPGAWGPCHLPEDPPPLTLPMPVALPSQSNNPAIRCGGGTQRRASSCVSRLTGSPVADRLCDTLPPPLTVQRCEVPCPRDCVVGEWSPWGPCEPLTGCPMSPVEQLTTNGYRKRTRRILVAASEDGAPCGSMIEVQGCSRPACARWWAGSWAACRPLEPRAPCGPGQRTRSVTCVDLQQNVVNEEQCARAGIRPIDNEPCQRACPYDCVVSGWSSWSSCSRSCATRHHRPYRSRNRTIIAPPGQDGHPCPPPDQLVQTEPCNIHSCSGYSWFSLPWQPCTPPPEISEDLAEKIDAELLAENITLTPVYMQYREVWCVENNDKLVKDTHCTPIKRPDTSRTCTLIVSQDCQLSEWSSWSDCPLNLGESGSQWRSREIVSEAIGSGAPCGILKERRACPPVANPAIGPKWSHGAWSSCQLPPGVLCGDGGLMTRGVWCSLHHHKVPPSVCMEHMEAELPASSLRCTVDCSTGCQYSDWSPWSKCESECAGDSTRSRKLLGNSACANTVVFEGHSCPCDSVNAQLVGSWSSCIVLEPEILQSSENWDVPLERRKECGAGARYRRLSCQDSSGHRLEPQACRAHTEALEEETALRGLVRESCWLACPVDCRMSRWSAWGPCVGAPCGIGLQTRTRNILVNASAGGRPCGITSQTKVCSRSCDQFAWLAGGWSECRLNSRSRNYGCGSGDQYRTVRCIEVATGGVVADALCDPILQPADLNSCHLPCPGECVVSQWSEWSQCSQRCDSHEQRDRTRALLRGAARALAAERCPSLLQAQPCILNRTCFRYLWKIAQWGDCLPLGGSPCGEGMQQREIYCERSDGRQVPSTMCDATTRPVEPTDKFCYVDCPIDCEVSEWSVWNFSQCKCGAQPSDENYITRTRKVITPASTTGKPCPGDLIQQVSCPLTPCYALKKTHFPRCKLDGELIAGAACGFGVSRRNISCTRQPDGAEVPLSHCANQLAVLKHASSEVSCFVDCYDDCRHSPWSHWSACDAGGVRSRRRVSFKPAGPPCPQGPVFKYEVYEYANCNVTESELNRDMSEWSVYDEPTPSQDQDQDDYYIHNDDQPEKTYLLFTGKRMTDEHTALAVSIASASLVIMLMVLYMTVRCHKQRTIHKV